MLKIREKTVETAQGMVEFALVLPILLLVILGIFAFGHLLFSYSSVISASREAARYGAVVGVSENGLPRFEDCAAIRAAAVRVGAFAGVNAVEPASANFYQTPADPGIFIGYDHGDSNTSAVAPYATCPGGVGSLGPTSVALGDRIMVRVTVQYQPIVPLVNLPSFPLTATTRRTIISSLPVGEAPTAEPGCISTSINFSFTLNPPPPAGATYPYQVAVGQTIIPQISVIAVDTTTPTGFVNLFDVTTPGTPLQISPTNVPVANLASNPWSIVYATPGARYYQVTFTPQNAGKCYKSSVDYQEPAGGLIVLKADTATVITSISPEPSNINQTATISFQVSAVNPGSVTTTFGPGTVSVSDNEGHTCGPVTLTVTGSVGTGSCTITWATAKTYPQVYAVYTGNASYNGSRSADYPHTVIGPSSTQITSVSPEGSNPNQGTTINIQVLPSGSILPTGTVTVLDSGGATICAGTLSPAVTSSTASCNYTWAIPGNYQLHASYGGDVNNSPSISAIYSHRVNAFPLVCPSFTNAPANFSGSNFSIGIQNTDPNYAYTISSMGLYWPGVINVGELSQITWNGSSVFSAQNNNQNFTNGGYSTSSLVPIPNGHKNWSSQSIAIGASGNLQFLFTNSLQQGAYALSVTFASPDGRTCTAGPINFNH